MVSNPGDYVDAFASAGCNSFTFHIECCDSITAQTLLTRVKASGMRCGIALKPGTPVETLDGLASQCTFLVWIAANGSGYGACDDG